MSDITIDDKKVKTMKCVASFPTLGQPKAFGGGEPKYGLTLLIPKTIKLSAPITNKAGEKVSISLLDAIKNTAVEKWGSKADAMIAKIKAAPKGWPIRDGDKEKPDLMGYPGHYFLAVSAKKDNPPGLVDRLRNKIDASEIYAGCYVRATLICYAYDNEFGKGFGFSLQNVQKLGDGKKFTGKKAAEDDFDEVEDESDDPENYEESGNDDDMGF